MWYNNENGDLTKPAALDNTSSKKYVYIRKDFIQIAATEETQEHWKWQEMKIPKEDWALYESIIAHDSALDDVYAALTELAELIVGEE